MKNNRIKIIFVLCAFTMLGSITNINAMNNNKKEGEILNTINNKTTKQDEKKETENNNKLLILSEQIKEIENNKEPSTVVKLLKEISKQLEEFNKEFSDCFGKLTQTHAQLNKIFVNNINNPTDSYEKSLEKIKEDYEKQKEEIEKTKSEYYAFLNIILENKRELNYESIIEKNYKIIKPIENKIAEIKERLKEIENNKKHLTIKNQLNEFKTKFSQYSRQLTSLKMSLNTIFFNSLKDSNDSDEKGLEKIKEDYEKQKEEIEKTKNEYNTFLNTVLENNEKLRYKNLEKEISRIISVIEDKIKEMVKHSEKVGNNKGILKQFKKFNKKFLQYFEKLSKPMIQLSGNFFNNSVFDEKDLKKVKENYEKLIQEILKTKDEYDAFLSVVLKSSEKLHYKNLIEEISKIIRMIKPKITKIDEKLLSDPKFNFNKPTNIEETEKNQEEENKKNDEESSFDIESASSIFQSSSSELENEDERKIVRITKHNVNEYIKRVNYLKKQIVDKMGKSNSTNSDAGVDSILLDGYADIRSDKSPYAFDMEKFLYNSEKLGVLENINTNKVDVIMNDDLKNYLLAVLDSLVLSIKYEFDTINKNIYCHQNDDYIEFSNNLKKFRQNNNYYIDDVISEITEDINQFNNTKNSIYEKIKEIFEDEIRHIFQKTESIDMKVPVSDEETKNLINKLNQLIDNKFKNINNKTELKNAVDEIFEEAEKIIKSHSFKQIKNKEMKLCIKNYVQMLFERTYAFVEKLEYYLYIYKNIKKLKSRDLYNIALLYYSVKQYIYLTNIYLTKDSQEIDEAKFLERLTMLNKNKIDYKLDEEDRNTLKEAFKYCNFILNEYISNFFEEHKDYEYKYKKILSEIDKKTSSLNEMQKLCYFKNLDDLKFRDLKYKDFNEYIAKNPTSKKTNKYRKKAIEKINQIIENRNNLNNKGLTKEYNNLNTINKFFKTVNYYNEYDFKNLFKAQILQRLIHMKYLNNTIKETINRFQDVLINKDLIKKEIINDNDKDKEYIEREFPKAINNYKEYINYSKDYCSFLINALKEESEDLQNSYNKLKALREKANSLAK